MKNLCVCGHLGSSTGDPWDGGAQGTSTWVWVHCRPSLHRSLWPRCGEADRTVCCPKWPSVSHAADAEGAEELPVWLPATTAQLVQLLYKTGGTIHKGMAAILRTNQIEVANKSRVFVWHLIHLIDWFLAGFNPSERSFAETEEGSREFSWGLGPGN